MSMYFLLIIGMFCRSFLVKLGTKRTWRTDKDAKHEPTRLIRSTVLIKINQGWDSELGLTLTGSKS